MGENGSKPVKAREAVQVSFITIEIEAWAAKAFIQKGSEHPEAIKILAMNSSDKVYANSMIKLVKKLRGNGLDQIWAVTLGTTKKFSEGFVANRKMHLAYYSDIVRDAYAEFRKNIRLSSKPDFL